jgi:hypothetical protein
MRRIGLLFTLNAKEVENYDESMRTFEGYVC